MSIINRFRFWLSADRIGPDILLTHWMLHFSGLQGRLARSRLSKFGEGSCLRPMATLVETRQIEIGSNVVIRPFSVLMANRTAKIVIGSNVLMGSGVHIYVGNHEFTNLDIPIIEQGHAPGKNVVIQDNVWVGANAIILPGVEVGEHSVIGAGSVVTGNVDSFSVYVGNPARKVRDLRKNAVL